MSRVINLITKVYTKINFSSYEKFMGNKYKSSLFLRFHKWWKEQLTPVGRTLFVLWSISSLPASMDISKPTYLVFLGIGFLIFFDHSISFIFIKLKIAAKRFIPNHVQCGDSITGYYEIQNLHTKNIPDLQVFERITYTGIEQINIKVANDLTPNSKVKLECTFRTSTRGHYRLSPVIVASLFPFGITRKTTTLYIPFDLFVYPKVYFLNLTNNLQLNSSSSLEQNKKRKNISNVQNDFIGTRDYQSGDRLQDIDHKGWARTGKPITKLFESKSSAAPCIIFLNSASLAISLKDYETAVSIAASITDDCYRKKLDFHFLFCEGEYTELLEKQKSNQKCMELLSTVQQNRTQVSAFKALIAKIPKHSSCVYIITPGYNDQISNFFSTMQSIKMDTTIFVSHDHLDDKSFVNIDDRFIKRFTHKTIAEQVKK